MLTPYQFSSNNPIGMIEIEGLEGMPAHEVIVSPAQSGVGSRVVTENLLLSRVDEINGHTLRVVYPSPGNDLNGSVVPGRVFTYVFDASAQHWNVYIDGNADGVDDYKSKDLDVPNTTERIASTGSPSAAWGFFLNNVQTPVNTRTVDDNISSLNRDGVKKGVGAIITNVNLPPNSEITKLTVYVNPDLQYGAVQELKYSFKAEYGSKYQIEYVETGNDSQGNSMAGSAAFFDLKVDYQVKATEAAPNIP